MHVNATPRLFELPEDGIQQFQTHIDLTRVFPRGERRALSVGALRDFGAPMTSRATSAEIVRWKGWDVTDPVLQPGLMAKPQHSLLGAVRRRPLAGHGYEKRLGVWGLP